MKEYFTGCRMYVMEWLVIFLLAPFVTTAAAIEVSFKPPKDIAGGGVSGLSGMDAGDIDNDGLIDVVAIEGGKHAGGRKTFAWFKAPTDTQGTWQRFDVNPSAPLRSFLGAVKLADMDRDGDLDLIVSSDNHSGGRKEASVFVFINPKPNGQTSNIWNWHKANGSSLPYHHINDMEIEDMDGDGKLDIVVRSLQPNQIHIFFQNSISSYTKKSINTDINQSEGLAVGHIDDDRLPDIAYTGYWLQSPSRPRTQSYTKRPIDPSYKNVNQNTKEAMGDIDGDGKLDVVIAPAEAFRKGGDHDLAWYRNPGGNYDSPWKKTVIKAKTNNHHTIKLGDMDNDNDLDVVVGVPWDSQRVQIYYNNGSGSFSNAQTVYSSKGLYSGVVADLGNDGDLDIIGQDTYSNKSKPWVYESLLVDRGGDLKPSGSTKKRAAPFKQDPKEYVADWTFEYETVWPDLGDTTNDIAVADIDGDGRLDIITDKYLYCFKNPGRKGQLWKWIPISGDAGENWWLGHWTGDFDGDGDQDVVSGHCADTNLYWFENIEGDGTMWARHRLPVSGDKWKDHIRSHDFNGDGFDDLIVQKYHGEGVYYLESPRTSQSPWRYWRIGYGRAGVCLCDIDRDGDPDVCVENTWFENPGDPKTENWTRHVINDSTVGVKVAAGDVNGDGRIDLFHCSEEGKGIWYFLGPEDPTRQPWTKFTLDADRTHNHTCQLADFDRDGDLDFLTAQMHQSDEDRVTIFENTDGTGRNWTEHIIGRTGSHNAMIADIDGDGWLDVVGKNWSQTNPIQIWYNTLSGR